MRISRLTVENIGIKLYDKVAAVLTEVIANCYDADAEHVVIRAPLNTYLAKKSGGVLEDLGHEVEIEDDGHGMTAEDVNKFYLNVGINRRASRGEETPGKGRRVMGRKGIGKLAPFGICREVEVWTAGGEPDSSGYEVAHLILRLDAMLNDTDEDYHPELGPDDGSRSPSRVTKIILRNFDRRRVPSAEDLHRQRERNLIPFNRLLNSGSRMDVADIAEDVGYYLRKLHDSGAVEIFPEDRYMLARFLDLHRKGH